MTYFLRMHRSEIWFIQFVLDSSDNLCAIEQIEMNGDFGTMNLRTMGCQASDLEYMLSKLRESCRFTYERV
ncbi:MAG TPA: DUF4911 domain-containing protein [Caldisericia bacterium]|nr:DUF4911 domain-containing protein [Caldisericia bacterium]HPF48410.1 DUF4911 domain-containing protein [Caldisericia bacterium]HPI83410.1 DUF4911 domain-containing protein [Caldisericia bacterium]HPQ92864.1 DUF4911 domain-containing protein [Caldisericia bacterium]HRV74038.1 DUF4911 domain-containing protein [Caldisericia bacterium]